MKHQLTIFLFLSIFTAKVHSSDILESALNTTENFITNAQNSIIKKPTHLMSDFSKAVFAGLFIKFALKLATSKDIVIFGYEIHKKSDSIKVRLFAEAMITIFEILRREWDGTADCCNSESFNFKIFIKLLGKIIGMRLPIPFINAS